MMQMQWFGQHWGSPVCDDCEQVETPVGEPCAHCREIILPTEAGMMMMHLDTDWSGYRPWHLECHIRSIIGGINHQMGRCLCCGGTEPPDPAEMTPREAARAAQDYFRHGEMGGAFKRLSGPPRD